MLVYACQLWSKYTQTSMKCLSAACNISNEIMHYIPKNVNVCPHQASHCVKTLVPFWEIICISFYNFVYLHLTFVSNLFKCLMFFTNLHFSSIIYCSCMMVTKGMIGVIPPSEIYESNLFTMIFLQFRKQCMWYKAVLLFIILSQQYCEVYFIPLTVAKLL